MTRTNSQSFESILAERVIAASPERVFAAWTNPKLLKDWWGPPGAIVRFVDVDLRIGGTYRIGIEQPNGAVYFVYGVYEEVDSPHRLTFTWRWEQPEMDFGISRVSIQLQPHAKGTHLQLVHSELPNRDVKMAHEEGWVGILESLIHLLKNQ